VEAESFVVVPGQGWIKLKTGLGKTQVELSATRSWEARRLDELESEEKGGERSELTRTGDTWRS